MNSTIDQLETVVGALLAMESAPTPEKIRELITTYGIIVPGLNAETAEQLAKKFEARYQVTMTIGSVLTDREFKPWLESAKSSIAPYYWERYRSLLIQQGLSGHVVSSLDDVTDRVLGLLENPERVGPWDRRGMVMGHVQSGKTANYIGLMTKAADAGYRLIVVIAGIHNNLRNQTQIRIDEGFIGRDSSQLLSKKDDKFVGVGKFDQQRLPVTFTNSQRDFSKAAATNLGLSLSNVTEPVVFVIKKNASTLKNLLEWLKSYSATGVSQKVDLPMLLIDDEADNATINTSYRRDDVTKINSQIRDLLRLFERSCYVGYTATPFANIFIDPDSDDEMLGEDLFPRSFIVSLDPPSNYFGASKVFIDESQAFIRYIEDNDEVLPVKHQNSHSVASIPGSLQKAIRAYAVARAIRIGREQLHEHSSMLVNVSRFTGVQKQLRNEIHNVVSDIQAAVRVHTGLPVDRALRSPELAALRAVWQEEFQVSEPTWEKVQGNLLEAVAPIKVVEINSSSSGALNYSDHRETGLNVIAVGGYSLSRGLTLEGLTTSYFLRNSMMYDTLMQMGRWFGYRPAYEDLCRIWMPEEAAGWYEHIANSIEELRSELRTMEAVGATPKEFGLKVRAHPDTLIVTARNKMGSGQRIPVSIGLDNKFVETSSLYRNPAVSQSNRAAARVLVERAANERQKFQRVNRTGSPSGWLASDISVDHVLDFLSAFENNPLSALTDPELVVKFIEKQRATLESWQVFLPSLVTGPAGGLNYSLAGLQINCQQRSASKQSDEKTIRIIRQRVSSRGIEKAGLTGEQIAAAEEWFLDLPINAAKVQSGIKSFNYPDWVYRRVREFPLLIVHLLEVVIENGQPTSNEPYVAWSMSFPDSGDSSARVDYVVNTTWWRENYGDDAEDVEEMAGDRD